MLYRDLQKELKERGESATGKKEVLIARLADARSKSSASSAVATATSTATATTAATAPAL